MPGNKLSSFKNSTLARAVLALLPALYSTNTVVNGWCLTTGISYSSSCSLRPAFAPSIHHHRNSIALWERQRQQGGRRSPYDDDEDFFANDEIDFSEDEDDFSNPTQRQRQQRRRIPREGDYYYDDYEDDPYAMDEEEQEEDDAYFDNEEESYNEQEYITPTPRVEWEEIEIPNYSRTPDDDDSYSTVYVLLPPSPPTMHPLPTAVLHFVGGTLFGSAPKVWYRTLLEDIVTHTQCAIIVTPLPVITPLNSKRMRGPLHHVSMAKRLQYQFQYAYEAVLEDEYGSEDMKSIPIAGLGHSLGSRLLVVLATLMKNDDAKLASQKEEDAKRRRQRLKKTDPTYQYKSMILISFVNQNAAAGIPGISSLLKKRTQLDQKTSQRQKEETRSSKQKSRRPSRDSWYDDDEDDDELDDLLEELGELWVGVRGAFQTQADRVKTVLTPKTEDLEFYPTPRQLWKALEGSNVPINDKNTPSSTSRYHIPQTLLIQFDQDDMDQSSKLATVLMSGSPKRTVAAASKSSTEDSSATATATTTQAPPAMTTDLKFARLRGTHLTPISTGDSKEKDLDRFRRRNKGMLQEWSSQTTKALWKAIQGRVTGGSVHGTTQEEALLDLRQSITRYITDIVTRDSP